MRINIVKRALALLLLPYIHGCGITSENRDQDLGIRLTAECGACDYCQLSVDGEGTEVRKRKSANVDEQASRP